MITAYLLLGSNLGDKHTHLATAITILSERVGEIVYTSNVYESEPWGVTNQPMYVNQAIAIETRASPSELLTIVKSIELQMGRTPMAKWSSRIIDIDILLYGDKIIETEDLIIPHPFLHKRNFALLPLMEIAANVQHPSLKDTIENVYFACRDTGEVYRFE